MKRVFIAIIPVLISIAAMAQTGSEILLFDLQVKKNKVTLSNPKNVTNHVGYDNQPSFHTDLPLLYYASFNEEGRSDIKSYNYKTGETISVTNTTEREYSPTLTPDKQSISCIIQRDNGAQDLGKYPVAGGDPYVIINNLIVGYHAWADNSHLAMFILGSPTTLHYLRLPTQEDTVIAENIGRSLHKIPNERAISFIHKVSATDWLIKKLNTETMQVTNVTTTLPGREDIAWTADGKIISSDGTSIFFFDTMRDKKWLKATVANGSDQLKGVTRLAVNAKGDKLAVVISE
jgi:Tol biopolymer transport system component